jgi:hypothetical protein
VRGWRTSVKGTPFAVDVSRDRRARSTWIVLLGGPLTGLTHFMIVYLVAEAGCTGEGHGLEILDPPVPRVVTLVATGVAAAACLALAAWAHRRWHAYTQRAGTGDLEVISGDLNDESGQAPLAFAGFLLSLLMLVTVLFVGLPAFALGC